MEYGMIVIQYGCSQCDNDYHREVDNREASFDLSLGEALPEGWIMAHTSSSTIEVFCSEKCLKEVLP
jgi:hypothetical protein